MFFKQFFIDGLAHMSYMVGEAEGSVAVIDPIRDIDMYLETAHDEGLKIMAVLDTHIHADYVSGARQLAERSGARLYLSAEGGDEWQYQFDHIPLRDGDTVDIGQYRITALHTPGHTPEHLTYLLADTTRSEEPWVAFTGDFLFVGDLGRPDLLGEAQAEGLAERLYDSVHHKLLPLHDGIEVFPNHGEGSLCGRNLGGKRSTTLGFERRFNYALQPMDREEFIRVILEDQPPAPPYFLRMKQVNKEGVPSLDGILKPNPLPAEQAKQVIDAGAHIIDARSNEAFGGAHIPDAYGIRLDRFFSTWVGFVVPPDRPIVLVLESPDQWDNAVRQLVRVGYDEIVGYLEGGMDQWEIAGYPVEALPQLPAAELKRRLEADEKILVLDVRTDSEWNAERFPYAVHIHAGHVPGRWEDLEEQCGASKDTPIAVMCRTGHRATIAASILKQKGFTNVHNVPGGINAWHEIGGSTCTEPDCPDHKPWQPWWQDTTSGETTVGTGE